MRGIHGMESHFYINYYVTSLDSRLFDLILGKFFIQVRDKTIDRDFIDIVLPKVREIK